jgi:hypothetical protein
MPFLTERAGDFAAAVIVPQKERGVDIMENAWSIVKVQHDITKLQIISIWECFGYREKNQHE